MKHLYLLLILFVYCLEAQNYTFSGVIFDAETKEALPGVYFEVLNQMVGGMTDDDGKFKFKTKVSSPTLEINYIGYEVLSVKLPRRTKNIIYIVEDIDSGEEVEINAVKSIVLNTIKNYKFHNDSLSTFSAKSNSEYYFKFPNSKKRAKRYRLSKSYNWGKQEGLTQQVTKKSRKLKSSRVFGNAGNSFINIFGNSNGEFITPLNLENLSLFEYTFPEVQSFNREDVYIILAKRETENGILRVKLFIECENYYLRRVETFFKPKSNLVDSSFGNGITAVLNPESGLEINIPFSDIQRKTITHTYGQINNKTFIKQYQVFQVSKNELVRYVESFSNYKTSVE